MEIMGLYPENLTLSRGGLTTGERCAVIFRSVFVWSPPIDLDLNGLKNKKTESLKRCVSFSKNKINSIQPNNQPTNRYPTEKLLQNCFKLGYDDYAIFINHLDELPGVLKR